MKKPIKIMLACVCAATVCGCFAACGSNETAPPDKYNWTVTSPDGSVSVVIRSDAVGAVSYTVGKNGTTVVEPSGLGFTIKQDDLRLTEFEDSSEKRLKGSYENISGKHATVEYDCNELTLTFKAYEYYLDVVMRVYDDGYAFRYNIRAIDGDDGKIDILSENTEVALPSGSTVWTQSYVSINSKGELFAYENPYVRRSANNLAGEKLSMPLLYKAKGTDVYSLVTESGLIGSGFYGSFLEENEQNAGSGKFGFVHNPATATDYDGEVSAPFTSPWRVGIVGDMKTVVESELVEKVYDDVEHWKPDNYRELSETEQAIYDYEWVDADISAWNWVKNGGNSSQNDFAMQKKYVDLAHNMGWKYTTLDAGWNYNFDPVKFREFMQYADGKGIKVLVWCDSLTDFAHGNEDVLKSRLDYWADFGIDGIKIDFFDGQNALNCPHRGEDKQTIKWYETIFQECAKRKMVVNCHGCNKPTGARRIYPNVINYEGIKGNESKGIDSATTVNSMFTRAVVGPTDFTPVVLPFDLGSLTVGHQMALSVLYESGVPSLSDLDVTYADETYNEFFKSVKALRDDTVFISGEPDDYFCAAVRFGDEWFIAGIAAYDVEFSFDCSFLGDGAYSVTKFVDTDDATQNQLAIDKTVESATKDTEYTVAIKKNGGFVYHLKKQQ